MARERLLVMNWTRILQAESGGKDWQNVKVMQGAEGLKPGFYNLFAAQRPEASGQYNGQIVHANKSVIYQQVGKTMIAHDARAFAQLPSIGKTCMLAYSNGNLTVGAGQSQARGRGL